VELDGEVGLAGERPAATDFGAAAVGTCRRNGGVGSVSRGSGSIRRAGRKRRRWRSFPASRRGRGRCGTPAMDGELRLLGAFPREGERSEPGRGKKRRKRRGSVALLNGSRGVVLAFGSGEHPLAGIDDEYAARQLLPERR
jgi:hypothetical protein